MSLTPIYLRSGILTGVGYGRSIFSRTADGRVYAPVDEVGLGGNTYVRLRKDVAEALGGRLITRTESVLRQPGAGLSVERESVQKSYWEFDRDISDVAYMSDVFETRTIKGNNLRNTLKDLAPVAAIVAAPFAVGAFLGAKAGAVANAGITAAQAGGGLGSTSIAGNIAGQATVASAAGTSGATVAAATTTGVASAATVGAKATATLKSVAAGIKVAGETAGAAAALAGMAGSAKAAFSGDPGLADQSSSNIESPLGVYPGDPNSARAMQPLSPVNNYLSGADDSIMLYVLLGVAALVAVVVLRKKG